MQTTFDKMAKRKGGQVTIFVILAIIIIAIALLVYFFLPNIKSFFSGVEDNPYTSFQSCIEDDIIEATQLLSLQGGSIDPEHYIVYNGETIEYLCYTNEFYETCVMQQPMLKAHVEKEIREEIFNRVTECFEELENKYDKK